MRRTATTDVEMHGRTIRSGDKVVLWFQAARAAVRVSVDRGVCVAHGQCECSDPDHFQINDDGDLELTENPPDSARETVRRAAAACPVRALTTEQ